MCCVPMAASPDLFSNLDFVASQNSNQKEKFNMKKIIIITGASSGFGALTARALAKGGHSVYASMRETKGRNLPQVEKAKSSPMITTSIYVPSNWTLRRRNL